MSILASIDYESTSDVTLDFSDVTVVIGNITITDCADLTSVDFSNLISVGGTITISGNPLLTEINFPKLITCPTIYIDTSSSSCTAVSLPLWTGGDLNLITSSINPSIAIDLSSYETCGSGACNISGNIESFTLPMMECGEVNITNILPT